MNEIKNKENKVESISQFKSLFFEEVNKVDKSLEIQRKNETE